MTINHNRTADIVDISLPDEVLLSTSGPTLVCGPSTTHKLAIMLHLLAGFSDKTVLITTKHPPSVSFDAYQSVTDEGKEGMMGVVHVDTSSTEAREVGDDVLVTGVESYSNLTRVGIEFSNLLDTMTADRSDDKVGIGVHTLSPMIIHTGLNSVYRFIDVVIARVRREHHQGVVVLDLPIVDYDATSLYHLFDAIIETRTNAPRHTELRVLRSSYPTTDWIPYS